MSLTSSGGDASGVLTYSPTFSVAPVSSVFENVKHDISDVQRDASDKKITDCLPCLQKVGIGSIGDSGGFKDLFQQQQHQPKTYLKLL